MMETWLLWVGRSAGLTGIVACLIAMGARLSGAFWIAGLQTGTLFQAGIAAMVFGCLVHLIVLTARSPGGG